MNRTIVRKMPIAQKVMSQTQKRPNYRALTITLVSVVIVVVSGLFASGFWKLPSVNSPIPPIVTASETSIPDPTPTSIPTTTPTVTPAPTSAPTPIIPEEILIFEPEYWKTAALPISKSDGSRFPGLIFTVPKGTKIYAPYDGVIGTGVISYDQGGQTKTALVVSIVRADEWDPMGSLNQGAYRLDFVTSDFQRVDGLGGGTKVKKGQLLGIVGSEELIFTDSAKNTGNFFVSPIGSWEKEGLTATEDPLVYLKMLVAAAEKGE